MATVRPPVAGGPHPSPARRVLRRTLRRGRQAAHGGSGGEESTPRRGHRGSAASRERRLKWSGKYEVDLRDNTSRLEGRKGKHADPSSDVVNGTWFLVLAAVVFISVLSYVTEEKAARAHDLAALNYWGTAPNIKLNFNAKQLFLKRYFVILGVARRKDGKWQARIGRIGDIRDTTDIYLGTFETEEAAEAYDIAAIELRGVHISNYCEDGLRKLEGPSEVVKLEGPTEVMKLAE